MTNRYAIGPLFAVRAAGVSFQVLEQIGTPAVSEAVRRVNAKGDAIDAAAKAALARVPTELAGDMKVRSKVAQKLSKRAAIPAEVASAHRWLAPYEEARAAYATALVDLETMIEREYVAQLGVIAREAGRVLPDFVLLEATALLDEVLELERLAGARHASQDRRRHRTLAMYLQRVCAKNDAFSRFGPTMWGTVEPGDGLALHRREGIARTVALETWVIAQLIRIIDADPDVRLELAPRLHPSGRLEPGMFLRLDEDREIPLSPQEHGLASACDGKRTARELEDTTALASLAERGVIVWKLERFARDTTPFENLLADIDEWRAPAVRERWRTSLAPLGALVERFADADLATRRQILGQLQAELERIGVGDRERTRNLYAAMNPINENCTLESTVTIGAAACDRLIADVSPWLELWKDAAAYTASRVYQRLFDIIAAAPRRNGALTYAALTHAAGNAGFDFSRDGGYSELTRAAWFDIRREFSELLSSRSDAPVWDLTADDCTFLRRRYELPPVDEIALPSFDLLACATSADDAAAGRFDWVVGESHHAFVLYSHATFWSCPDKPALHEMLRAATGGHPLVSRDSANDMPVHVNPEAFLQNERSAYCGSARAKPEWNVVRPADATVFVDEAHRDIRLRSPTGADLGSLVRTASTLNGVHPFFPLVRSPHEPRLRLGSVTVQRRAWYIESAELAVQGTGVSAAFLTAFERLRADRGIPRWVYVRPSPAALNASKRDRDKDTKPICIDLESLVSLDILERRLRKYETMVLVEMLPTPDQIFLRSADGPVLFELRTNVIPRA